MVDMTLKKCISYGVLFLLLLESAASASGFRFSPRPNRAHLIQWREWGDAAFEEAKKEEKLVLLSLSAVWCHWCHVMDETTYSDDGVIEYLNEHFIPIRVDADLRPDIDSLYNQGGWPSTVILTPGGEVISGGNYLPVPEMLDGLKRAAELYALGRDDIERRIAEAGRLNAMRRGGMTAAPGGEVIVSITTVLKDAFDDRHGGFGSGQKFPNPHALEFLLARFARTGDRDLKRIITATLDTMAAGGIYDRIEGGFFRYAVKPDWSEPHYEKMLEVNAGLIRNYAEAYQVFGAADHLRILKECIRYVRKNLADLATSALYGSQDADESYYRAQDRKGLAPPFVDRTVYADSSSLMISALVSAAGAAVEQEYLSQAEQAAGFLLRNLFTEKEGVAHYFRDGKAGLPGLLSDNALFGLAMMDLYGATGDQRYLAAARRTGSLLLERFYDKKAGQFRPSLGAAVRKPATAGAFADVNHDLANYRAVRLLGRLLFLRPPKGMKAARDAALLTYSGRYRGHLPHAPAYGIALLGALEEPLEITIIGFERKAPEFLAAAGRVYVPDKVVRVLSLSRDASEIKRLGYPQKDAVYLCAGKRCSRPITAPERMPEELTGFLKGPENTQP